jgi:Icc-related predicted phosphoesterase
MKIVCISDTHGLHGKMVHKIPDGDILLIGGDISNYGTAAQLISFNDWLGGEKSKFDKIICIGGNHDYGLDLNHENGLLCNPNKISGKELLTNCIYLDDEEYTYKDVKIYGSPITPWFYNWAFNRERGVEIKKYWEMIPTDTDILITHGPPYGVMDYVERTMTRVGCEDLSNRIKDLTQLKLHLFGHIHQGYGIEEISGVTYVNASICDEDYNPLNKPIILEIF